MRVVGQRELEQGRPSSTVRLGVVHRGIGEAEQLVTRARWRDRDADARCDVRAFPAQVEGLGEGAQQAGCELLGIGLRSALAQDERQALN